MMLNFREWLVLEWQQNSPHILLPYVKHRMESRLTTSPIEGDRKNKRSISNDNLRHDYQEAMTDLYDVMSRNDQIQVMYRKALRVWERHRDHIDQHARLDEDYGMDLVDTDAENDIWMFVAALEDMLQGKMPNLEELL